MASSLSLFSPCSNAASIGLHSSAHDAFSSYPYLVSTTGLRRRQLPQILSSTLAHGRHWKALAGDTRVHAEGIDIERGQEKNVRSLLPLYTSEIESSESSCFTQCHNFTLKTANFLPRCRWRLGGFHVANLYDNLSVKLLLIQVAQDGFVGLKPMSS
jgi:hypothetical protein